MKRIYKILLGCTLPLLALPFATNLSKNTEAVADGVKVYTTDQHYVYKLQDYFTESPDTFEAWINVPRGSEGGSIAGNYLYNIGTTSDMTVEWNVDLFGRFQIVWGCSALNYTFEDVVLSDGLWHQVALTRDPLTNVFSYYVDGSLKGSVTSRQRDAKEPIQMCIGNSLKTWTANSTPFNGKIKEVCFYHSTLTGAQINENYRNGGGYNAAQEANVLADIVLGEQWTEKFIKSTVGDNIAYLNTQDKYVPVADTPDYDYTIIGMPDIQSLVDFPLTNWDTSNNYLPMMQWVSDHIESDKIKFCVQVGDVVDNGSDEYQWVKAQLGFDLWDGKLPFSTVPGNHDYTYNCLKATDAEGAEIPSSRDLAFYNEYLGEDYMSQFDEFGGTFDGGIENSYYLFECEGVKYLNINLEIFPRMKVIRWAGRLCEQFPDRRVIVNTHAYTDYYGRISGDNTNWGPSSYSYFQKANECTFGKELWEGLISKYKNIFMTLSGHYCVDDAVVSRYVGVNGNPIISMLIDTQCTNHWYSGRSWTTDPIDAIMLMKFNETNKEIYMRYYSPKYDGVFNLQNQFTMSFADWQDPLQADYSK